MVSYLNMNIANVSLVKQVSKTDLANFNRQVTLDG